MRMLFEILPRDMDGDGGVGIEQDPGLAVSAGDLG
jgi:hypothetical protein